MTSGPDESIDSPLPKDGGALPRAWMARAYDASPLATFVVAHDGQVLYINDAACTLLAVDTLGSLGELASLNVVDGSHHLTELITRSLAGDPLATMWRGGLATDPPRPLQARFTPLPHGTDRPTLICRLTAFEPLDGELKVRLMARLAGIHRQEATLDDAGQRLVDIIFHHLRTPVIARWRMGKHQHYHWQAGAPPIVDELGAALDGTAPLEDSPKVHALDDPLAPMVLGLDLGDQGRAQVAVATRSGKRSLDPTDPFWSDLAIAAEGALQSARRLEQHRQERVRLTAVVEQMPMGVAIFDRDGEILHINPQARAMAGRSTWTRVAPEEQDFTLCDAAGETIARDQWPFIRALDGDEFIDDVEYILQFPDHRRHIRLSVLPIIDEDGQVMSYLAMGRDITASRQVAQRKDEFLSVASHELRSPLTPLAGLVRMALRQAEADRPVDPDLLTRSEAQINRLQRLIDAILDISRLESGKFPLQRRPTKINQLLRQILDSWLKGPQGERLKLTLPDQPVTALVDPDRLEQVITNVVDNAIKHGRQDGTVNIGLTALERTLTITVRDEGDGIDPAIIDRVFDRYFAISSQGSAGTGLGLYIARQIVEEHSGSIAIDSGIGEPTTVTIELPLSP